MPDDDANTPDPDDGLEVFAGTVEEIVDSLSEVTEEFAKVCVENPELLAHPSLSDEDRKAIFEAAGEEYDPSAIPEVAIGFEPENGIYENVELQKEEAILQPADGAYFWSTNANGMRLIDVDQSTLPTDPIGWEIQLNNQHGVPILNGEIVNVGREDGFAGQTTLVVDARQ